MNFHDFDQRMAAQREGFERQFRRAQRWALIAGLGYMAVVLSVLCFIGWVIVKLMQHFQVI